MRYFISVPYEIEMRQTATRLTTTLLPAVHIAYISVDKCGVLKEAREWAIIQAGPFSITSMTAEFHTLRDRTARGTAVLNRAFNL